RDLILSPPDDQPFDKLRSELIKRSSASEQRRLQQLITSEELGDRTPSQLLRRLQQLVGDRLPTFDTSLLRELFLQWLPSNVRMVLVSTPSMSLDDLAQLTDRIMEVALPIVISIDRMPGETSAMTIPQHAVSDYPASPVVTELGQRIFKLTHSKKSPRSAAQVAALVSRPPAPHQSRSTSRPRYPSSPRRPCQNNEGLCWYHKTFANDARRCHQPCSASGNELVHH
ncbi:uncharacterized protein LOC115321369, partial [Ixodes scapularis]|uniref:uncharacterized protein LOC115321369 n=1 Tax=Ixodes scapularis TaxID=6945 RepID=UPI001A9CE348